MIPLLLGFGPGLGCLEGVGYQATEHLLGTAVPKKKIVVLLDLREDAE